MDEGKTPKTQGLECSERIFISNNSETNDRNKDDKSVKISEQMELNKNSDNDSYRDYLSQNNSEYLEQNKNSEVNDRNRECLSKNVSSQGTKSSRKLFFNASINSGEKMKKVKKSNCKKGPRTKLRRDNLNHTLRHDS